MEKEKIIKAIKKYKDKKVGVVGDVVLDRYIYGIVERVNPESPAVPLLKVERKESRLGCAANVALNLVSLGASVSLFCILGDDSYGILFEKLCAEKNINLFDVKEGQTIIKERSIESEFNKYLMRADSGESTLKQISNNAVEKLYNNITNSNLDAIILSDYNKSVFKGGLAKKIIKWANSKGIPVIVDPKPKNIMSFNFATLLCPNIKEAMEIVGGDGDEIEVAKKLKEKINSDYIVVTCGKNGMVVSDGNKFIHIPTKARELIDVTGAGDTVTSLLALNLISGLNLEESAYVANHAAGIVIGKRGTSTLSTEELINAINHDSLL